MTISNRIRNTSSFQLLQGLKAKLIKEKNNIIINFKIFFKWYVDSKYLPLTKNHWKLYKIIHFKMYNLLNKFPDLIDCKDFNDKIQWLKLFDQDELLIQCSDKIMVREYIKEKIGIEYLVKLYQVHDFFSEIDFISLPNSFVIKTNHDSGTVILVKDKSKLDIVFAKSKIEASLKKTFGWENGEWAYAFIQPKILIEEYIDPLNEAPPADYKFQCVDGKVKFCRYTFDRGIDTKEIVLDEYGNDLGFIIDEQFKKGSLFVRNSSWNSMINLANKISEDFKCVRVDMYCSGNSIYIGELTFFPYFGMYSGEGQKKVGSLLDFSRDTFKDPLINRLNSKKGI